MSASKADTSRGSTRDPTATWLHTPDDESLSASRRHAVLELVRVSSGMDFRVSGDCMVPILEPGQTVEITPGRIYWPGDIVAFEATDGRILVHRVLGYDRRKGGWHYVTGADAASGFDDPVESSRVLGRVSRMRGSSGAQGDRALRIPLSARLRATKRFFGLAAAALRRRSSSRE